MKKSKKRTHHRFKTTARPRTSTQRIIELEPEEMVIYIRRAEKHVIPLIKKHKMSPAMAFFLLAQYTQVLITGDNHHSVESATAIANNVRGLWQAGLYTPGSAYPYTLEETLADEQGGLEAKEDYAEFFQPFTPSKDNIPLGLGKVAGGIVRHPETNLWQIWMMLDGPCQFLGAYKNPDIAQKHLETIVEATRKGGTMKDAGRLYTKIISGGDGTPKQISIDMMLYLLDHQQLYTIEL